MRAANGPRKGFNPPLPFVHNLLFLALPADTGPASPSALREGGRKERSRGARHHIFSAIAMNLADEVRRIVAEDPSALNRRQSRNENHRMPLHFALLMNRQEMIALLLELGADPLSVDGSGQPVAFYASPPDADRRVMEKIRAMLSARASATAGTTATHATGRHISASRRSSGFSRKGTHESLVTRRPLLRIESCLGVHGLMRRRRVDRVKRQPHRATRPENAMA